MRNKINLSKEQLQEIEKLYQDRISMTEISKRYSICRITLRKLLRDGANIYCFMSGGGRILKSVSDLLYKDVDIYLDRKYERYCRFCESLLS